MGWVISTMQRSLISCQLSARTKLDCVALVASPKHDFVFLITLAWT
jgi:hypothetical protein